MAYMDNIYNLAFQLLQRYGRIKVSNVTVYENVYDDNKIRIVGGLDDTLKSYKILYIAIKLKQPGGATTNPFLLPSQNGEDDTPVYFWKEVPQFYRPGRWPAYLNELVEIATKESEEARKLAGVAVDDDNLFPSFTLADTDKVINKR